MPDPVFEGWVPKERFAIRDDAGKLHGYVRKEVTAKGGYGRGRWWRLDPDGERLEWQGPNASPWDGYRTKREAIAGFIDWRKEQITELETEIAQRVSARLRFLLFEEEA